MHADRGLHEESAEVLCEHPDRLFRGMLGQGIAYFVFHGRRNQTLPGIGSGKRHLLGRRCAAIRPRLEHRTENAAEDAIFGHNEFHL